MNRAREALREFGQVIEISQIVRFAEEAVALIVATLHDVQADLRNHDARRSGHTTQNDAARAQLTWKIGTVPI
jgi:hypothetical protein